MKYSVTIQVQPTISEITLLQEKLNLTDQEMEWNWLKQYIQDYFCPEWFEVTDVKLNKHN